MHSPTFLDTDAVASVQALRAWYLHTHRQLPWRTEPGNCHDPYPVLVSEIMLQQTTVATVIPYFERWMQRWPTLEALAQAPMHDVLSFWQGLGYYRRARNLVACAQALWQNHQGQWPQSYEAWLKLPGIGAYTAGALMSIAYQKKAPVVDGNVQRVVSRMGCLELADVPQAAYAWMPEAYPGDHVQALMDLGSGICKKKDPLCASCPVQAFCAAYARGCVDVYPPVIKKKAKKKCYAASFVIIDAHNRILLRPRTEGVLKGLLECPSSDWRAEVDPRWEKEACTQVRHIFTHIDLLFYVFRISVDKLDPAWQKADHRWVDLDALAQEPVPTMTHKVIQAAQALPSLCIQES